MFLSFPVDAWLLLLVAVGLGLGLEIAFYRRRRADGSRDAGERPGGGPGGERTGSAPTGPSSVSGQDT